LHGTFQSRLAGHSCLSTRADWLHLCPLEKDQPGVGDGDYRLPGNSVPGLYSLASKPLFAGDIAVLLGGLIITFAATGLMIWIYFLVSQFRSRGFALPVLFMNAGNMGIPLALFAFGESGMQRATLLLVIITLFQYSLGIYVLSGRGQWRPIFRLPLIYAGEKFGQDPDLAASIVILSTLISVFTIPLVFWLIL
jgi:predicted permease